MTAHRPHQRLTAAVAAAIVAATAVTGCGAQEGASGDEIVLGALGPYTGTFSSTYGAVPGVLNAWVETVNAAGGIGGKRVRIVTKDIGASPGAAPTAVRELVERDRVIAIVANQDPGVSAWAPYAAGKGIPVLSAVTETDSYVNPGNFNAQGSSFAVAYGLGEQAKEFGGTLGIVHCAEQPTCAQQAQLLQLFVKAQGVEVPVTSKVPASTADFTAYCQQLKDAKVGTVFNSLSNELAERMNDSCAQQGLTAKQVISGALTNLSWKSDPVYRGSVVLDPVAPFFATSVPGVKKYRDALSRYAPSMIGTEQDNSVALRAWASMQVFGTAAAAVQGPVTSASLRKAIYGLKGQTLDGIVPPIAFEEGKATYSRCYFRWSPYGEFKALDDGKPVCVDPAKLDPLVEPVIKSLR
ncbi:ABC transporter substrate-binding protein [Thermopolyspora sp. NPDC052614]|uniref:ABC transporter substrate-binding protein n=1 Tax=Thermopolyspora sp. NPDC052614 TaxID=3155682 RepID=UPI003428EC05